VVVSINPHRAHLLHSRIGWRALKVHNFNDELLDVLLRASKILWLDENGFDQLQLVYGCFVILCSRLVKVLITSGQKVVAYSEQFDEI